MPIRHEDCATAKPSTFKKALNSILVPEYAVLLWAFSSQRVHTNPLHPYNTQPQEHPLLFFLRQRPGLEASEENMCTHVSSHSSLVPSSSFQQLAAYRLVCSCAPASDTLLWSLETVEERTAFVHSRSGHSSPMGRGQQENCQGLDSLSCFVFPNSLS